MSTSKNTGLTEAPKPRRAGISRRLELVLMLLVVAWLVLIIWLTFFEPLAAKPGAGFGFWCLVLALLLGTPDLIYPLKPNPRIFVAFFATLTGTAFVGYREFAVAANAQGFGAGDLLLLVFAVVLLFNLVVARKFRPVSVSPPRVEGHEQHEKEGSENKVE